MFICFQQNNIYSSVLQLSSWHKKKLISKNIELKEYIGISNQIATKI
jgi:hypothetical protein